MREKKKLRSIDIDEVLINRFVKSFEDNQNIGQSYINFIDFNKYKSLMFEVSKRLKLESQKFLLEIIYQSKYTASLNVASSNAITLLNFSNFSFKDQDFSNIKVPFANLSNSQFISTNLENSDFSSTNLKKAHFFNCNFRNSDLSNANFGKSLRDDINLPIEMINGFHYDENNDLLIVGLSFDKKSLKI